MNTEKAIEEIISYMHSDAYCDAPSNEACTVAVAALRENLEREKGCPWCKEDSEGYVRKAGAYSIHNGMLTTGHCKPIGIKYCPWCGRKIKTAMPGEEV